MVDLRSAVCLVVVAACGDAALVAGPRSGADRQRLAPLQSPCVFTAASSSIAITLAAGELGMLEKRALDSALLVNGLECYSAGGAAPFAKSTTVLTATVTGDAVGGETFVFDFSNGAFLRGTSTTPALVVDLGGGSDSVQLRMTDLRDTLRMGANGVDLTGDGFVDVRLVNVADLTVALGDGDDSFSAQGGGALGGVAALALTLYGGNGNDVLTGGDGNDRVVGDLGNDTLSGGTSATDSDTFVGGGGTDTVTYAGRSAAVSVTVGAGTDDGAATETDDVQADVEVVVGGDGADQFTGTAGPQTFYGGQGDDVFHMGLLASTGAGADVVYGEAGVDTADYAARLEAVVVTMDLNQADDGSPGEGDTVRSDVEKLTCPSAAVACTVTGNALGNLFVAGGGDATIDGLAGDDVFVPSSAGTHHFTGGVGVDRVDFSAYGATIDVRMDDQPSSTRALRIAADVEDLTCPSASACTVQGNEGNNHLIGSSQVDQLSSLGGDDLVETNGGADVIDCGTGSDILVGAGMSVVGTTCEL